jgi:antibiotic biosynthesis monooxygenase (ABM) superfamily enzyme
MNKPADSPDSPVTIVRIHYVKEGCEPQFEAELRALEEPFSRVPGNLGFMVFRPGNVRDGVYRIVYKFASQKPLDAWHRSPEYRIWLEREQGLTIAPPDTQKLSGLETWFTLPGQNVLRPPTKARQAVVTWCAALPVSILISLLVDPFLDGEPFLVQKVVFVTLLVVLLTWIVMPLISQIAAGFLYPDESDAVEQNGA